MKKLITALVLLGLFFPAYAQDAKDNLIWNISDFSGGLNTKISPESAPQNQSTICENVRFDTELKSITKRDDILLYGTADATEPITGMHRLYLSDATKVLLVTHGDEIEKGTDTTGAFTNIYDMTYSDHPWQFTTYQNMAIGGDGYNPDIKYDGSSAEATNLGSCLAINSAANTGPGAGTYTYKVAFYTTSYRANYNVKSNPVTGTGKAITLTMIPVAPTSYGGETVTGRKIYRSSDDTTWYLLPNGIIADNSTLTITDVSSSAVGSNSSYATTADALYTPPMGEYFLINQDRLFIAGNETYPSRLYYSESGLPDAFAANSYFDIRDNDGDDITFIKNVLGLLTVGKDNTIQKVYTTGATPSADWSISDPFSFTGCQAPNSVAESPVGVLYLNRTGIYKFDGQNSTLISEAVTPEIQDISASNIKNAAGIFYNNKYYLSYCSEKVGGEDNNRTLLFDLLSNAYEIDTIGADDYCAFNSGTDWGVLYSGDSTTGKVFAHTSGIQSVSHYKQSDFSGTFDDVRYIPTTVGGNANSAELELAWDCTINGWTTELSAKGVDVDTLDHISSTGHLTTATIDRPDGTGTYISPVMQLGVGTFDKLYWNEKLGSTGDVKFYLRSGVTSDSCEAAAWSDSVTDPNGSDVSTLGTAGERVYVQYRISMDTTNTAYTPTIYKQNGYDVKLTYLKEGTVSESSVPLTWQSGWSDLGAPGYDKILKTVYIYYDGDSLATFKLTFENYEGDEDHFDINLTDDPTNYTERFTTGAFRGNKFRVKIENNDLYDLRIKSIVTVFDVEPIL